MRLPSLNLGQKVGVLIAAKCLYMLDCQRFSNPRKILKNFAKIFWKVFYKRRNRRNFARL